MRQSFRHHSRFTLIGELMDGVEAISYLLGEGQFADRQIFPIPDLLVLDLKMPRLDGFDVLRWVRRQPGFASLVIVVLTSSELLSDVNQAYALGANSFMVKPMDFENTTALASLIQQYWLKHNRFPQVVREIPKGTKR